MYDRICGMLDAIDERGKGLTDWEIEFVDSLLKQTDQARPLTEKQIDTLKDIYNKRVEGD